MNTPSFLDALWRSGALRTLDHAFARTLARLDPNTPDLVLAAAALASLAVASGHAGFDPREPQRLVDADIAWPAPEAWLDALATSRWITCPAAGDLESATDAPLVLEGAAEGQGLIYLRRYREYERRLALGLQRIGANAPDAKGLDALSLLFAQLFPDALLPPGGEGGRRPDEGALPPDLQARAAATALRHNLVLVTGGPGTGKTTTTARLLVLLVAHALQHGRTAPRIALAAPTGRAAERMAESVRNAVSALTSAGIDTTLTDPLPATGTTLHRLLGTIPDSPDFRHHADNPLPFDIVVVDEASMVDLPLMAKLVEAIADGARLVLLGDPDQLPSVEAGDVLSGILRAAGDGARLAPDDAEALQPLLGLALDRHPRERGDPATSSFPASESTPPATERGPTEGADKAALFPGRHIHLQRGYRQSASLDLAPLAAAVRAGDTATTLRLLRSGDLAGVHFHENLADPLQAQRDRLLAHWSALADADNPADALALAARLRLLTAVREGPQGARSLNARIEAMLSGSGLGGGTRRGAGATHFHGRLLLVTENSYRHQLFNGDIGICLRDDADGTVMAWFPGDTTDAPRAFHPAALPAHDSAFAMTVHKAQGSEFDEVWLLLPARDSRVLSRELVYTGITRARRELHVAGSAEVIEAALGRHASRWSGLGWRLGEESAR
jgi:exodeoxyribonuclease V alpha subunit